MREDRDEQGDPVMSAIVVRRRRAGPRRSEKSRSADEVASELAALPGLTWDALKARWQELYDGPPPPHLSRAMMVHALAYRIQEKAFGGLDPATRRELDRAARDLAQGRKPSSGPIAIKPGTRLLREWGGVVHEVIVLEKSVRYRGEMWPSLSAVAREITGARWSGPRFFGLREKERTR